MKFINNLKNNKVLRIMTLSIKAIASLFIILVISIIFIQRVSDNKLTLGGYSLFTVITESMLPAYEIGDMVLAKEVSPSTIKVGDDVVYLGEKDDFKDRIVTHRVISTNYNGVNYEFETKGIANDYLDPLITDKQLYGVVIYKSVLLSFLSRVVNNVYGFYFVIFVPLALIIFFEVIDIINGKKEIKKINENE